MGLILIGLGMAAGAGLIGHRVWNGLDVSGTRKQEAAHYQAAKDFQAQVHKGFHGGAV